MAGEQQMKPAAELLLIVNFCMYVVVLGIGGRAMNRAIFDHGFIIGPRFDLPAHFWQIYFPIGNAATGFFVTFSLIAGVVGAESYCCLGFTCKETELHIRNVRLRTIESFLIILSATQLPYIAAAIHGAASR